MGRMNDLDLRLEEITEEIRKKIVQSAKELTLEFSLPIAHDHWLESEIKDRI
jgi:hypothetical protein